MAITTRLAKGAPLTFSEMDANLTGLANGTNNTFTSQGTGAVVRNLNSKLGDVVSVLDFGAKGDGTTDDTTAVQNAITYAISVNKSVYVPGTTTSYKLTSPINLTAPVRLIGDGWSVLNNNGAKTGSIFQLAHLGVGFNVTSAGNGVPSGGGTWFEKIATLRNQTAPGVGWTPIAAQQDFLISNTYDVYFKDVMMINPTSGIKLIGQNGGPGSAGRLNIDGLYGQPLNVGIDIETSYDVCRLRNIHFWVYWQDDPNVHNYTLGHLTAFQFERVDNALISDVFCIYAQAGFLFGLGNNGIASKVHINNADVDLFGSYGLVINGAAAGTTLQLNNFTCQGETSEVPLFGSAVSTGILSTATNSRITGSNIRIDKVWNNAIQLNGTTIQGKFTNLEIYNWNIQNTGNPAVNVLSTSTCDIDNPIQSSGGNGAALINDATKITSPVWVAFTPVISSGSGTLTTASGTMTYMHLGTEVHYQVLISITTNGTGANSINFTLPIIASAGISGTMYGWGREAAVTGKAVIANIDAGTSLAVCTFYDNTYPGGNGTSIRVTGFYRTV